MNLVNINESPETFLATSQELATGNWWLEDEPNRVVSIKYQAKPVDEWGRAVDEIETPFAPDYDAEEYKNPALVVLNVAEFSMMAQAFGVPPPWEQTGQRSLNGKRLLDVGCGTGRIALYAASLGAEVTAIDQTAGYVVTTAAKASRLPKEIASPKLKVTPIEVELENGEDYDFVTGMFAVINHCKDWQNVLTGLAEKTRFGGKMLLSFYGSPKAAVFEEQQAGLPYAPAILVRRGEGGMYLGDGADQVLPARFPYPEAVISCLEDSQCTIEEQKLLIPVTSLYPREPSAENVKSFLTVVGRRYGSQLGNYLADFAENPKELLVASGVADSMIPLERIDEAAYFGLVAVKNGGAS